MSIRTTAPIIAPLRVEGGTFYTFSSSVNDSSLLFSTDNIKFGFSKFACIKLPDWKNQTEQRLFRDAADIGNPVVSDPNTVFPKSYIQDYIENLLQFAEDDRIDNTYQNFSEAALWKALRHVSDTDISAAPDTSSIQLIEDVTYTKPDLTAGQKYVERALDETPGSPYEPVVKYIGDVNMINHIKNAGQEYTEVYCHIPTDVGAVLEPKFKPNDSMMFANASIPAEGGDEWIVGRQDEYTNNTDNVKAIYDNGVAQQYDVASDLENLGLDFAEFENRINDGLRFSTENFEFNAIILYYDIFDAQDESTLRRNAYGILLLDRMQTDGGTSSIPSLLKYAPSTVQPGNTYGFRFNMKFSDYSNQLTSEITINSYSTISMELYLDALQRISVITDTYDRLSEIVAKQQQDIQALKIAALNS